MKRDPQEDPDAYQGCASPMNITTSMPLLPPWLAWIFVTALSVVVLLHLWHAWSMHGHPRLWHLSHILMGSGMIVMYLVPQMGHADLYWGGVVLYGTIAVMAASMGWMLIAMQAMQPLVGSPMIPMHQ